MILLLVSNTLRVSLLALSWTMNFKLVLMGSDELVGWAECCKGQGRLLLALQLIAGPQFSDTAKNRPLASRLSSMSGGMMDFDSKLQCGTGFRNLVKAGCVMLQSRR